MDWKTFDGAVDAAAGADPLYIFVFSVYNVFNGACIGSPAPSVSSAYHKRAPHPRGMDENG
ncbi:MAG: hypothetical protein GX424_03260 [Clostridiales bacterium]|nr:hypothetical protein [Clostridiales bacterium]